MPEEEDDLKIQPNRFAGVHASQRKKAEEEAGEPAAEALSEPIQTDTKGARAVPQDVDGQTETAAKG